MEEHEQVLLADFVAARAAALVRFAYLMTGDRCSAEDLFQSALAKTIPRWRNIRHADPEAYLRAVMYKELISWWRRLQRARHVSTDASDAVLADPADSADIKIVLRAALRRLPPSQRAAVILRYYNDLPEARVAEIMNCSIGTVRSRTNRAVARLRQILTPTEILELQR